MNSKTLIRFLMLLALLAAVSRAQALCVPAVCTCQTVTTNVAFGSYSPLAYGNTVSTGSISVSCGGVAGLLIPYSVSFSAGGGGSFSGRRMSSGANTLAYNLYVDPAYTTIWGDGTASSQTVAGSVTLDLLGLMTPQVLWVYGQIPARQLTAVPGIYSDTINVTLTYY